MAEKGSALSAYKDDSLSFNLQSSPLLLFLLLSSQPSSLFHHVQQPHLHPTIQAPYRQRQVPARQHPARQHHSGGYGSVGEGVRPDLGKSSWFRPDFTDAFVVFCRASSRATLITWCRRRRQRGALRPQFNWMPICRSPGCRGANRSYRTPLSEDDESSKRRRGGRPIRSGDKRLRRRRRGRQLNVRS